MAAQGVMLIMSLVAFGGCREAEPSQSIPKAELSIVETTQCAGDSLRPTTAAPAEGLWIYQAAKEGRIAAMIGPTQATAGRAAVTRRIEVIETQPGGEAIRHRLDSAEVRLELLPPFRHELTWVDGVLVTPDDSVQPAAAYRIGSLVILASYEPCGLQADAPRVRYLRRERDGRLAVDVMLRRESRDS